MAARTQSVRTRSAPAATGPETLRVGPEAAASEDVAVARAARRRTSPRANAPEPEEGAEPRRKNRVVVLTGPLELDGKEYPKGWRLTLPDDEAQGFVDDGDATYATD